MSREVLDSGSSDTKWDEPDVAPSRLSVLRRRWLGPVALVVAFLIGGAAGALSWNAWQDQQDAAVAASTIDLTARLRNAPTSEEATLVQGYIRIENEGPETVRIEEIAIAGPGYVPRSDSVAPFGVESEGSVTQRIAFDIACDDSPDVSAQVRLQVRTANGVSQPLLLPLVDEQRHLWRLRPDVCQRDNQQLLLQVRSGEGDSILQQPEQGIRLPVWIESQSERSTVITSIRASSQQLEVVVDSLPIEVLGGLYVWTFATWQVKDCAVATTLDYGDLDLVISGTQEGGEVREATVSLDPDLALDVSTFVIQTCSQR